MKFMRILDEFSENLRKYFRRRFWVIYKLIVITFTIMQEDVEHN